MKPVAAIAVTMVASALFAPGQTPAPARQRVATAYAGQAVHFEPNLGQSGKSVKFLARGHGYTMHLTSKEAELYGTEQLPVRIRLVGANPAPLVEGLGKLRGESNYFIGRDPASWRTHVPNYGRVRYGSVYPGVDLVYYGNGQQIEHDFIVTPGADPRQIRFQVNGARRVELDRQGDLVIHTAASEVRLRKPAIYQEYAGKRREVAGKYILRPGHNVGFEVGTYDAEKALVIDPVLAYSTYIGGDKTNLPNSLAFDAAGNAYVAGTTDAGSPTNLISATQTPFVTKLSPDGQAIFTSHFGTSGNATLVAVDRTDSVYVGGWASGTSGLPITADAFQKTAAAGNTHAWFGKVGPDGSTLVYCTYLGGSGRDRVFGLAVDAQGNAVATGYTGSTDFPTAGAIQPKSGGGTWQGFVSKLNGSGSKLIFPPTWGAAAEMTARSAWPWTGTGMRLWWAARARRTFQW